MEKLLLPWAKTVGDEFYPLLAHLIDTATAMGVLYDEWLPARQRATLDRVTGGADVRALLLSAAATHDLGKANPVFQGQLLSKTPSQFTSILDGFAAAGVEVTGDALRAALLLPDGPARTLLARHEFMSAVALTGDYQSGSGFSDPTAAIVAGHHGLWREEWTPLLAADEPLIAAYLSWIETSGWADLHTALLDALTSLFPVDTGTPNVPEAAIPTLTGLVVLADWIASSETSVGQGMAVLDHLIDGDLEGFTGLRTQFFASYLPALLGTPRRPSGTFENLFGFKPDRAAQPVLTADDRPGLRVVMVPTGEGKTEAALGHWLNTTDGLFFALPTMATADAMLGRVRDMFANSDVATKGALTHGHALLNSFYSDAPSVSFAGDEGPSGALLSDDWFTKRHRALLAPIAVGTVDQLLMGMLRNKFNFLRLTGLFTKTVVLDEIHTFDPYMADLLERFLEWAGALSINVVALSATLPKKQVNAYVAAYRRGAGFAPTAVETLYPGVVTALLDGSVTSTPVGDVTERTINLEYAFGNEPAATIVDTVANVRARFPEAKIGVIVNTVATAQQVGASLTEAQVVHSRFKAKDRSALLDDVFGRYGKHSGPGADVLVATQIVEQSVDVDFDVLVTELCPAPSLIQRIGRVWRHDLTGRDRSRPLGLTDPLCVVVAPHSPYDVSPFRFLPYAKVVVARTWAQLQAGGRERLSIPTDVQGFVDGAYVSLDELEAAELQECDDTNDVTRVVMRAQAHVALARRREVLPPSRLSSYRNLRRFSAGDRRDEVATRISDLETVRFIFAADAAGLLTKTELSKDEVVDVLNATVPRSTARPQNITGFGMPSGWEHRLVHDILVVDDSDLYDERLGLYI